MRILFVTPCYKPYFGGVERVVEQFCRRLAARPEVEAVGVLTSFYRYPSAVMAGLPATEEMDGATVYRLPFLPRRLPGFYHLDTGLFAPRMGEVLRRFRPTHLHTQVYDWFLPNLQAFLMAPPETARVQTIYDHRFTTHCRVLPFVWANRWSTHLAEAVHVVSEQGRANVVRDFAAPAAAVHVVPLGADLLPPRPPQTAADGPLTILSVGRICRKKGQLDLLRALAAIDRTLNRPWRLVLVGDDGGEAAAMRELVERHGLHDRVLFAGHVSQEELDGWYGRADLFALLTGDESFGLVFTEAMAAGLPVLTCDVGPLRALFPKGAVIVPHGDQPATEQALVSLLADDARRAALAREAYAFVRDHMSWDLVIDRLIGLYRDAAEKRKKRTV